MAGMSLESLHAHLRLLENASELKRKMPTSTNPRSLKEGLHEMSRLVGIDDPAFMDPRNIAALIGPQRFVMIGGEPSVTDHVARVFDSARVLLTVLVDPSHFENPRGGQMGAAHQQGGAMAAHSGDRAPPNAKPSAARAQSKPEQESQLDSLKPLLSGNTTLTCRLFRALFEHMLGFASQPSAQQANVLLVNELTGSREHSRPFLCTALFILGAEIDKDNLMPFMLKEGLFGMPIFEHLLQNRDYCSAYYGFRRLERAFIGSPAEEEMQLLSRIEKFSAQFGGRPSEAGILNVDDQDKARVDAHLAAVDLLEALALTPLSLCLTNSIVAASSNCVRSIKTIAQHFKRFADGEKTKAQANQEISDHLLAFAQQFSADSKATSLP